VDLTCQSSSSNLIHPSPSPSSPLSSSPPSAATRCCHHGQGQAPAPPGLVSMVVAPPPEHLLLPTPLELLLPRAVARSSTAGAHKLRGPAARAPPPLPRTTSEGQSHSPSSPPHTGSEGQPMRLRRGRTVPRGLKRPLIRGD
jgi:hypothetical protein